MTRWGLVARYTVASLPLLAGLVGLIGLAVFMPVTPGEQLSLGLAILDPVLFPVSLLLIRWRRRHPLAVATALSVLMPFSASSSGMWAWGVISMSTRRKWRWALVVGLVVLVATAVSYWVTQPSQALQVEMPDGELVPFSNTPTVLAIFLAMNAMVHVALVAWGFYVGARRDLVASLTERAETAEREQALRIAQAQSDERARIAREMHDVLAHRISLVSMHAGVLAYRDDLDAEATREVARIIQANSAESLTELRAVLGALRQPGAAPAKPQPTLTDLAALVDEARAAGTTVTVSDAVADVGTLPPATGRHAYRIVQEALTNARKHAVDAPVRIELSGRPGDGLTLVVANPLTAGVGLPTSGLGLVGLAERAQIAGGHCSAGVEEGRFVVRAWLPWQV